MVKLIRQVVGAACLFYAISAGWAAYNAGTPLPIDWYVKILALVGVGVIALSPDLLSAAMNHKWQLALPKAGTVPSFQIPAITPLPANYVPGPVVVPVPVEPVGDDPVAKTLSQSKLMSQLAVAANGDKDLIEKLSQLNDGFFRKSFLEQGSSK